MQDQGEYSVNIERTFDAPIEKVWDAWADPTMFKKWSCPEGFEIIDASGELVEGQEYKATMKSDFYTGTILGKYLEVSKPNKIVFSHYWDNEDGTFTVETTVTVTLENVDGKTKLTLTQTGFENQQRSESHNDGWASCFDKLAKLLEA